MQLTTLLLFYTSVFCVCSCSILTRSSTWSWTMEVWHSRETHTRYCFIPEYTLHDNLPLSPIFHPFSFPPSLPPSPRRASPTWLTWVYWRTHLRVSQSSSITQARSTGTASESSCKIGQHVSGNILTGVYYHILEFNKGIMGDLLRYTVRYTEIYWRLLGYMGFEIRIPALFPCHLADILWCTKWI